MPKFFTVGQVADDLHIKPRTISDLFYSRHLDPTRCQMVAGRRLIPEDYVGTIRTTLIERGILHQEAHVA